MDKLHQRQEEKILTQYCAIFNFYSFSYTNTWEEVAFTITDKGVQVRQDLLLSSHSAEIYLHHVLVFLNFLLQF